MLKPCPHCGGKAELFKDGGLWWAECEAGCRSRQFGRMSEAERLWNARTPGPEVSRLLAAAKQIDGYWNAYEFPEAWDELRSAIDECEASAKDGAK